MFSTNFNPQSQIFYRPIDIALRWWNLIRFETQIVQAAWSYPDELRLLFPQWPCLQTNIEVIYDAVRHGELPYGCLGISGLPGTAVELSLLTVRHSDLRHWMQDYYPDQRPGFFYSSQATTLEIKSAWVFTLLPRPSGMLSSENGIL